MPRCKNCASEHTVKNGKVRRKQRFRCKECSFNFVEGDARTSEKIAAKKAMLILLYSLGTKIVSKKVAMVDLTLRLWQLLTLEPWFEKYQAMALSIYKLKLSKIFCYYLGGEHC